MLPCIHSTNGGWTSPIWTAHTEGVSETLAKGGKRDSSCGRSQLGGDTGRSLFASGGKVSQKAGASDGEGLKVKAKLFEKTMVYLKILGV